MPAGSSGSGSRSYPVTRSGRTACLQAESSVLAGAVVRGSGAYPDERLVQGESEQRRYASSVRLGRRA